ncbi:putative immunity/bacteriocin fusion bifunctional protein [Sediminibacillus halophilus]|uniref:Putative immunity protein/bacteriocin n=1 Tax=Sediminibacillus halophilus TaxID=482461 RepID=A0A1G9S4D8_9BACI|nr:putative immunity/bacteriocin fusion bifunctional protein [Sediminibacillus halophilus]SDM30264.1 putative immunity protein/bacteriocin [Sediminibacillus halophilus]
MRKTFKNLSNSRSLKLFMLLSMVFMLLSSSPLSAVASTSDADNDCGCNGDEINEEGLSQIEGEEKIETLSAIETDSVFENNVDHDSINADKSKVINLGESEYANGEVLQVTSLFENSMEEIDYDLITVFVEKDSKKVLKLSYFEVDADTVDYKDFDETGQLMIHKEFSYEDFSEGNLENGTTHYSVYEGVTTFDVDKDSFWYKFACSFSGQIACMSGCVASFAAGPGAGSALFTVCSSACSTVWSAGLC